MLKISETVIHPPSDAHHAQASSSAQVVHSGYSLHRGDSEGGECRKEYLQEARRNTSSQTIKRISPFVGLRAVHGKFWGREE